VAKDATKSSTSKSETVMKR